VLLHVAAVDGRHGGRPTGRRPAPTLPRQGLGSWRSEPRGLREPPPRRRGRRRWETRARFPRRARSSLCRNGAVELWKWSGGETRPEGLERGGEGRRRKTRAVMGSGWRGAVRDGLVAAMTFRGQESEQKGPVLLLLYSTR
jgi:hypothetical protein